VLVFNKIDRLDDVAPRIDRPGEGKNRVWVSARDGKGLDLLREALGEALQLRHVTGSVRIASQDARLRARLHELGAVRSEQADEHGWVVEVDLAVTDAERLFAQANGEALRPLLETVQAPT
jgi:GTP-binding protein HflX